MSELQINGISYRTGRLNAKQQFHVMRRLAPLLTGIGKAAQINTEEGGAADGPPAEGGVLVSILRTAAPIVEAIGAMPDDQAEYVIDTCLSACERQSSGAWARIQVPTPVGPQLMFQDIDLPVMLQLCYAVIQENFESFFADSPGGSGVVPLRASS